jgi:hypothetical protein
MLINLSDSDIKESLQLIEQIIWLKRKTLCIEGSLAAIKEIFRSENCVWNCLVWPGLHLLKLILHCWPGKGYKE